MKLGNQGFGLKEMIIYTCLLLLLLVFVSIEINSFYKNLPKNQEENQVQETKPTIEEPEKKPEQPTEPSVDENYYQDLECKLKMATQTYIEDNPYELGDEILTIDANTLINLGYISSLYAQDGTSTCQGYSNVYIQDGEIEINPHITCYNYQTSTNN